ncbi:hypothetical protein JYT31_02100 [Beggiatoa alba]|nr:hypothetical protein [Beggiatoa alba]
MTKLSYAVDVAGKWLEMEGVDMVIPRPETNEVVIAMSSHSDSLKNSIPAFIKDIPVKICYVKSHVA